MPRQHTPTPHLASPRPTFATRHPALRPLAVAAGAALLCSLAWAQATPPPAAAVNTPTERPSPKVERISHEDAGSRVDELRVGGQTRQIDVHTKTALPGYQIRPDSGAHGPASAAGQRSGLAGSPGRASWKLTDF